MARRSGVHGLRAEAGQLACARTSCEISGCLPLELFHRHDLRRRAAGASIPPTRSAQRRHRLEDRLSDEARKLFGIFGSECGRSGPCAATFRGLVGVSGSTTTSIPLSSARVDPLWEMVYHGCQICWGKYGYSSNEAAEFVAHHICARPLYYPPCRIISTGRDGRGRCASGDRASYAGPTAAGPRAAPARRS